MIDQRTELLINRKLDGELTPAESLELDKLLIRDPQARALMEEYALLDEQAGVVLGAVTAVPAGQPLQEVSSECSRRPLQWWYSFGLVSAVAAAITFAVLLSQRAAGLDSRLMVAPGPGAAAVHRPPASLDGLGSNLAVDYASLLESPRRETLNVERDVIGFWDRQSRSLYLIEADVARALLEPVKVNY